ncbi:MAG: hypothetical protein GXP06_02325 [Alphaproteobacteria bacterium]|nr:hypothetical protein [Alphaproteobacteria bacterium]
MNQMQSLSRWSAARLISFGLMALGTMGLGLIGLGPMGLGGAALANDPAGHVLECYQGETIIFTADIADINQFDASAHNVTLTQTVPMPQQNAIIYYYGPDDILCVVVTA